MFRIVILAFPKKRTGEFRQVAGAYASCWIDFKDSWDSEVLAKAVLRDMGWSPRKVLGIYRLTLRRMLPGDKRLYQEAKERGYSFHFDIWTIDAHDQQRRTRGRTRR